MSEFPEIIPIFPLYGTILLPNTILPLHIFEPRYREMIEFAMEHDQVIGMVQPIEQDDPLVDIRNQELQLKAADMQRKQQEFDAKQEMEGEKERNDVLIAQQRIDAQEKAIDERSRVAEERIQTQRDIAALNSRMKGN